MKNTLAKILNYAPVVGIVLFIGLCVFIFSGRADAKYKPSSATLEMSKDIKAAQEFVREYEIKILEAKNKATVYRETICRTEKEACTKDYLDPLGSGVDLSVFIIPSPKS